MGYYIIQTEERVMFGEETFHDFYHQLASAWKAHHGFREFHGPLESLAGARLRQARLAMWDWRGNPTGGSV